MKLQLDVILSDDILSAVLAVQIDWLGILRLRSTIGRGVTGWLRRFPAGKCPARHHGAENRERSDQDSRCNVDKRPVQAGGIVI